MWNVGGLNKKERRRDVIHHLSNHQPSLVALVETKVKECKAKRVENTLHHWWGSCNNYDHSNLGRIWVGWNKNVWDCQVVNSSYQHVTIQANNFGGLKITLTIVYASNSQTTREELWRLLGQYSQNVNTDLWAVLGDFNSARFTNEKEGERPLTFNKLASFNTCINQCSLSDLSYYGSKWTWNNSSEGQQRIRCRLDMVLCKPALDWCTTWLILWISTNGNQWSLPHVTPSPRATQHWAQTF